MWGFPFWPSLAKPAIAPESQSSLQSSRKRGDAECEVGRAGQRDGGLEVDPTAPPIRAINWGTS
jgi:hypothetical protein